MIYLASGSAQRCRAGFFIFVAAINYYMECNMRRLFLMLIMLGLWSGGANAYLLHKYQYNCIVVDKVYSADEIRKELMDDPHVNVFPDFVQDGAVISVYNRKGMLFHSSSDLVYVPLEFRGKIQSGYVTLIRGESFRHHLLATERLVVLDIMDDGSRQDDFWYMYGIGAKATGCPDNRLMEKGWYREDQYKDGEDVVWQKRK